MTRILVPIADGTEEMEAVIIIDVLRRAGIEVASAAIGNSNMITGSRGVQLHADMQWNDAQLDTFDAIVLPGGAEGTNIMIDTPSLLEALQQFSTEKKWIGAICAAPLVLQAAGILGDRRVTCHPGVTQRLDCTPRLPDRVVCDGRLITSQGPGTAFEFALVLIKKLLGEDSVAQVVPGLILPPNLISVAN
jgi:4-methyl-5(b-hydroxyethyl)-thiazole monophosphate biosynthesis